MHRRPVVAVALVGVALAASGCGSDDEFRRVATEQMVLETCAPGGEPLEVQVCRCAFEEVSRTLSDDGLERLDRRLRDEPDQVPAEVQEAILDCTFAVLEPPPQPTTTAGSSTTSTTEETEE